LSKQIFVFSFRQTRACGFIINNIVSIIPKGNEFKLTHVNEIMFDERFWVPLPE